MPDRPPRFECGSPSEFDHHVVPLSRGGTATVPLCRDCHGKAHDAMTPRMLTRDALQHKIRTNSRCGKVRLGSIIDPADPRLSKKSRNPVGLVPEPAEAGAIALMARLRAHGLTFRAIAAELTARGIPTKEGAARWDHTVVRKILRRTP